VGKRAWHVGAAGSLAALSLLATAAAADDNRAWLDSIRTSKALQQALDTAVHRLVAADPALDESHLRIAVVDLDAEAGPRLAHRHGDTPVYPASVVKFVYLMATYAWVDRGRLEIDSELGRQLDRMIHASSNKATQKVVRRLTGTEAGPALPADRYAEFRDKRLSIKRWLATIGIDDLHCLHPTYDGDGDLHGRDRQLLEDAGVAGGLPARGGEFPNRQAMTASGTARLLALLATGRALSPRSSAEVRRRMHRDVSDQPYLRQRIAGGVARCDRSARVDSKTGTYGRIIADAGIVRNAAGHEMVIVAFIDSAPRYRGSFIADLSEAMTRSVLGCP